MTTGNVPYDSARIRIGPEVCQPGRVPRPTPVPQWRACPAPAVRTQVQWQRPPNPPPHPNQVPNPTGALLPVPTRSPTRYGRRPGSARLRHAVDRGRPQREEIEPPSSLRTCGQSQNPGREGPHGPRGGRAGKTKHTLELRSLLRGQRHCDQLIGKPVVARRAAGPGGRVTAPRGGGPEGRGPVTDGGPLPRGAPLEGRGLFARGGVPPGARHCSADGVPWWADGLL